MNHFENNIYDGMELPDAIETLNTLTGCIATNAVMTASGECEVCEKDAGAWWAMIALSEGMLAGYPEDIRRKGFEIANENVNRELVEKARREEAKEAAERTVRVVLGLMKED